MIAKTLYHLTLNTGHVAVTPRAAIENSSVIATLTPLVTDTPADVPTVGWGLKLFRPQALHGRKDCWAATQTAHAVDGAAMFTVSAAKNLSHDRRPNFVHCVACWNPALSKAAWRIAKDCAAAGGLPMANVQRPHHFPWLAIALDVGIQCASLEELGMLGDFERCFAWTLIENRQRRQGQMAA